MRAIVFAVLLAAGIGLAGAVTPASAAPANGAAISDTAKLANPITQVQHWRWRSRRWGWGWRHRRHCFWRHYRFSRSVRRCYW